MIKQMHAILPYLEKQDISYFDDPDILLKYSNESQDASLILYPHMRLSNEITLERLLSGR